MPRFPSVGIAGQLSDRLTAGVQAHASHGRLNQILCFPEPVSVLLAGELDQRDLIEPVFRRWRGNLAANRFLRPSLLAFGQRSRLDFCPPDLIPQISDLNPQISDLNQQLLISCLVVGEIIRRGGDPCIICDEVIDRAVQPLYLILVPHPLDDEGFDLGDEGIDHLAHCIPLSKTHQMGGALNPAPGLSGGFHRERLQVARRPCLIRTRLFQSVSSLTTRIRLVEESRLFRCSFRRKVFAAGIEQLTPNVACSHWNQSPRLERRKRRWARPAYRTFGGQPLIASR
jgi:hypothetical protein